jgi:glycosyltransferase involved in cell wall biosynthesis
MAQLAARFVAVSNSVRDDLIGAGVAPSRVDVAYIGIDAAAYRTKVDDRAVSAMRRSWGVRDGDVLVGTMGSLGPVKGMDFFVEMAAKVAGVDNGRTKFVIVGESTHSRDAAFVSDLRRRVEQLGLGGRLVFAGQRPDPATCHAAFDVFVLASREEPFAVVNLEAMAVGRPIVATDVGGNPDGIEDGVTGVIAVAPYPDGLAAGVLRLTADPALRLRMGAAGRARVEARFTLPGYLDAIQSAYQRVLEGDRGAA